MVAKRQAAIDSRYRFHRVSSIAGIGSMPSGGDISEIARAVGGAGIGPCQAFASSGAAEVLFAFSHCAMRSSMQPCSFQNAGLAAEENGWPSQSLKRPPIEGAS